MTKDEALKMALGWFADTSNIYASEVIVALQEAIACNSNALAQQEPAAVVYAMQDGYVGQMIVKDIPHKTKLYTHPAPPLENTVPLDTKVDVVLELPHDEMYELMLLAHKHDLTLNAFVEYVLSSELGGLQNEIKNTK